MDDVTRLTETPFVHERGFTISPNVDANLRDRIRCLLISRNRQQPPTTPCPSPDYNYLPRSPDGNSMGHCPPRTQDYKFSPAQAIAKLVQLEYEERDMGATRFDGPAGQIEKDDADVAPRRPSQPNIEEARNKGTGWAWSRPTSGLDHRAQQDILGRESSIPNAPTPERAKSSVSKKSNKSRSPRFYLRTVPPAMDVNKTARTKPQHIPGSYRSEIDAKRDASSRLDTPLLDDKPDAISNDILAVPTYTRLRDEHGHSAIDALHELEDHVRHAVSAEALRSAPRSPISHAIPTEGDHGQSPVDVLEAPVFVIGSDYEEDNIKGGEPVGNLVVSKLPIEHSRVKSSTEEQATDDYLTGKRPIKNERKLSSVYSPSVYRVKSMPLETDKVGSNMESPLLPKASPRAPNDTEPAVAVAELPVIQSTKSTPEKTQKSSPVSRAMSMLSDMMSVRSGIQAPSPRSFQKQLKSDSSNLTIRPHHYRIRASEYSGHHQTRMMGNDGDYRPLKHENLHKRYEETDSINGQEVLQQHQNQSESFAKVITDLEGLLKEALNLADHATSRDHSEEVPLTHHHRHKDYGRVRSHESVDSSECVSSLSGGADEEDNYTTLPHRHDSHRRGQSSGISNQDDEKAKSLYDSTHREVLELPRTSSQTGAPTQKSCFYQPFTPTDWAVFQIPSKVTKVRLEMGPTPPRPQEPPSVQVASKEQHAFLQRGHGASESGVTRESIREYVNAHQRPPIEPRVSSMRLRKRPQKGENIRSPDETHTSDDSGCTCAPYVADFKTAGLHYHPVYQEAMAGDPSQATRGGPYPIRPRQDMANSFEKLQNKDPEKYRSKAFASDKDYNLENRHHFSIHEPRGFSLSRSHRRSPIARDWSTSRKRQVAIVACITTAFMGLIIGIYAGEVPAIQYAIADEHHYTILGNVLFFLGLAITTGLFYPLPLLHGRKPYTLAALTILLPLQFPQALAINSPRTPTVAMYRVGLLLPRIFAGMVMGFANINLITTLLDLFGASLQSGNPHEEIANENDVRRHGGGMGVWLGIWTFCSIGSIGTGFLIGAGVISGLDVSWGFWITIIFNAAVLLLNIVTPETRRSAYRRSMAEVRTGRHMSRRVARGEIKMHLQSTGPIWWGEEVFAGHVLAIRMLKQPGFIVLSLYLGWIYGQVVLVMLLLGALLSKCYLFRPQYVGLAVAIIPLGALLAIPFQKASLLSRSRHHRQRTDSMTFEKRVTWTSHLVRRAIFMITLPFADMAYTLASGGHPTLFMVPIIFAGLIGFLSNLAIAECHGIIMETYDTSDLQPGMTGRPRRLLPEEIRRKRTNFSCFPRVTAAFSISQTCGFIIAAGVTAWGGVVERHVGAQIATAVMAGILLVLTLLLIGVLWRYKTVQIIPSERFGTNILSGPEDEWKPVIIGNPSGTTRRMSILELGYLSRWSEIRRRNKLAPQR